MKILGETRETFYNVERSYDRRNNIVTAYVTESATNWYVTLKVLGYACPSVLEWKVSKREAKSAREAAEQILMEAKIKGNI